MQQSRLGCLYAFHSFLSNLKMKFKDEIVCSVCSKNFRTMVPMVRDLMRTCSAGALVGRNHCDYPFLNLRFFFCFIRATSFNLI